MKTKLKTVGYLRISSEKDSSKSIENQQHIIENFVKNRNDLELATFYIDKNLSGTTFNRPQFETLISDIEKGKIDCVIVSDLSRLGRDLISVGYYTEVFFPTKNVKFIAIADKIETSDGINNTYKNKIPNTEIPIKALLDEQYSVDTKTKINASLNSLMRDGKFIGSKPPFGYKRDISDKHKLISDENSHIVAEIFKIAHQNIGITEIVRTLNKKHVKSPTGSDNWNSQTIKKMLCNRTYCGDLLQVKDEILVLDTHKPIIDREIFLKISESFENNKKTAPKREICDNPLKGKVICATCGSKMQRRRGSGKADWHYFTCITNNRKGFGCETGMYIRENVIENAISLNNAKIDEICEIHISKNDKTEIFKKNLSKNV